MNRSFFLGILATLAISAAVAYGTIASGCINPGADEPIPEIERWAAKTSLRAYLKANVPKKDSPVPVNEQTLQDGAKLYLCAACHGFADGKSSSIAAGLYKRPPIFVNEDWSKDDDNLIYWFIDHGVRLTGMPAYNKTLPPDDMWKMAIFVKHMKGLPEKVDSFWKSAKATVY
jgi:mono/diheme cytochrome c family protein